MHLYSVKLDHHVQHSDERITTEYCNLNSHDVYVTVRDALCNLQDSGYTICTWNTDGKSLTGILATINKNLAKSRRRIGIYCPMQNKRKGTFLHVYIYVRQQKEVVEY